MGWQDVGVDSNLESGGGAMATNNAERETGAMNTLIGKGSAFEGSLQVESSIRVDGVLRGKLTTSDTFVVGNEGEVEAEVTAKNAIVSGRFVGTLEASNKVVLESSSSLFGELKAKLLVVEEGATLRGECEFGDSDQIPIQEVVESVHQADGERAPSVSEAAEGSENRGRKIGGTTEQEAASDEEDGDHRSAGSHTG